MGNVREYKGFKDLMVYQKAFDLSIEIFHTTRKFPKEELYSLTDQIRRSSRSIGANIAESWPKRKYEKAFIAKLIDAQSEACETIHWLDESVSLKYIDEKIHDDLTDKTLEIQRMLQAMIQIPSKFCH